MCFQGEQAQKKFDIVEILYIVYITSSFLWSYDEMYMCLLILGSGKQIFNGEIVV